MKKYLEIKIMLIPGRIFSEISLNAFLGTHLGV
jgi:hypothetical protein